MCAGCGLPPGPGGLLGAAEGLSYLSVTGLAGWGAVHRIRTNQPLPGALVVPEVLSYGAVAAGAIVLAMQVSLAMRCSGWLMRDAEARSY